MKNFLHYCLFISIGLLPFVPEIDSFGSLSFILLYIIISFLLIFGSNSIRFDASSILCLSIIVVLLPLNFIIAQYNGIPTSDFIRASIPFIFIISYFLYQQEINTRSSYFEVYILISCLVWSASIIVGNFNEFLDVISGKIDRLAYIEQDMLIPFGLIGFVLSLYMIKTNFVVYFILCIVFMIMIFVSGYRSQLGLALLVVLFRYRNFLNAKSIIAIFVGVFCILVYFYLNPGFVGYLTARGIYSSGDAVRLAELRFALDSWLERPFFGNGLGFQVPLALTRPEEIIENFNRDTVPYIHNFLGYILMDTGILGLLLFSAFLGPTIAKAGNVTLGRTSVRLEGAFVCFIAILAYFMVSASFRQVQMWIVLSLLMLIVRAESRRRHA